jgi:ABC-2 type transport system permease protein
VRTTTLLRLEWKSLFASRAVTIGHALVLAAGAYGLYCGRTVIDRQKEILRSSPDLYREHLDYLLATTDPGSPAGGMLFYLPQHTHHEPSPWAAFSIGQRDVNAFNAKVRLLTLEGQLYDSELSNPESTTLGHFDAAFVLVFLVPLLVIAVVHDLVAGERELGIWSLVRSAPVAPGRVVALKLFVRLGSALGLALGLLAMAVAALRVPFDGRVLGIAIALVFYVLFWFGAGFFVAALGRSPAWNAVALLGLWIVTAILGPSLSNVAIATLLPVPDAMEVTVRQRQGYHESWDLPQKEVMANFYRRYPEYARFPVPEDRYSDAWYYAMNQRGDDAAFEASRSYRETLARRVRWSERVAVLFPPVAAQAALDRIARTDLTAHLEYLDSVREYHEQLKSFFYPIVFREDRVAAVDWSAVPAHRFEAAPGEDGFVRNVAAFALEALLLFGIGSRLFAKGAQP